MNNKNKAAIYYTGGCYGTFLEWCLNYFSDHNFNDELPFTKVGSAHKFTDTEVIINENMFKQVLLKKNKFSRLHPGSTSPAAQKLLITPKRPIDCYRNELTLLEKHFDKVIVLYFNFENILWGHNNLTKSFVDKSEIYLNHFKKNNVVDYRIHLSRDLTEYMVIKLKESSKDLVKNWNKNSIEEMQKWELREFLSLYLYKEWIDLYQSFDIVKKEFLNVKFIEIGQLRDNFVHTITNLLDELKLPMIRDNVDFVYNEWNKLQFYKNRDLEVKNIVQAVLNNKDLTWNELSIIDEAEIQRQLRNCNWEIKCFGLDRFPTSTKELKSYLIPL